MSSYLHFSFNQIPSLYTNNIPSFLSREFCNFWHIIFLIEFYFWKAPNVFISQMRKQRLEDGRGGIFTLLLCFSTPGGALYPTAHLHGAPGGAEPQSHCSQCSMTTPFAEKKPQTHISSAGASSQTSVTSQTDGETRTSAVLEL